ncbi:MAG: hypothetical protein R3E54_13430 [Halioglobus sp.]
MTCLDMPLHIPEICNWRLSGRARHHGAALRMRLGAMWEQEFAHLEDLTGPYMINPHHWGHVDRWFDPESGVQAIDARLSHAFSLLVEPAGS